MGNAHLQQQIVHLGTLLLCLAFRQGSAAGLECDWRSSSVVEEFPHVAVQLADRAQTLTLAPQVPQERWAGAAVRVTQHDIDIVWRLGPGGHPIDGAAGNGASEFQWVTRREPVQLCLQPSSPKSETGTVTIDWHTPSSTAEQAGLVALAKADAALESAPQTRAAAYREVAEQLSTVAPVPAASAYLASGVLHFGADDLQKAAERFASAEALARRVDDALLSAWIAVWRSRAASVGGAFADAEQICKRGATNSNDIPPTLLAELHSCVGITYHARGDFGAARSWYERALSVLPPNHQGLILGKIRNNLGALAYERAENSLALEYYTAALPLFERFDSEESVVLRLTSIASAYSAQGDHEAALSHLQRATQLPLTPGYALGDLLFTTGKVQAKVGHVEAAIDSFSAALSNAERTKNAWTAAWINKALGTTYLEQGADSLAAASLEHAAFGFESFDNLHGTVMSACDLMRAYSNIGRPGDALSLAEKTVTLLQKVTQSGMHRAEGCLLEMRAYIAQVAGDTAGETTLLAQARATYSEINDEVRFQRVSLRQAAIALENHNHQEAMRVLDQSEAAAEQSLLRLTRSNDQRAWLDARRNMLDMRVRVLWELSEGSAAPAAFAASASARNALAQAEPPFSMSDMDGSSLATRRELAALMRRKERLLATPGQQAALSEVLAKILALGATVEKPVALAEPRTPITLERVQDSLPPDALLLHFHLARNWGVLWAISADSATTHEIPGRETLAPRIIQLHEAWATQSTLPRSTSGAPHHWLADVLFAQVAGQLRDRRLLVVLDRELHLLPVSSLAVDFGDGWREPLLTATKGILHLPHPGGAASAAIAPPVGAAVFAPELSGTFGGARGQEDLERIQDVLGTNNVIVESSSDAANILNLLTQPADVLYIASHARAHNRVPDLSAISLTDAALTDDVFRPDPMLTSIEIRGIRLAAPRVVLAACETGRGRISASAGPMSLAQAFLDAGAEKVLSTLWPVPAFSSTRFGELLFEHLRAGESLEAALRLTQISVRDQQQTRKPLFWAGYTLVSKGAFNES